MTSSTTRLLTVLGVVAIGLGAYACGGGSPAGPTPSDAIPAKVQDGDGAAGTSNNAPVLVYKTTPRHVKNEIFGKAPLQVKINVCNSTDADEGDSLRSDIEWGDGVETGPHGPGAGTDPEDDGNGPTGCGGPDCCRHRHEYKDPGRYTIKIKLTDKHLEDQSGDVSASALTTATLIAKVGEDEPPIVFSGFGSFAGVLDGTDPTYAGCAVPTGAYDTYNVVHPGGTLTADITTNPFSFDTVLELYSPTFDSANPCTNNVASNDDDPTDPVSGLHSLITGSFAAGDYVVVVSGFFGATGNYTIDITN